MADPVPTDEAVLDRLPIPVIRFDAGFRYRYVNPRYAADLGLRPGDIVGKTFADLGFPDEPRLEYQRRAAEVLAAGRPAEHFFWVDAAAGRRFIKTVLVPERGPDGRPATVLSVGMDFTSVGTAEAARLDAETMFRAFMRHLPANAWMKDEAGRYVFVNESVAEQFARPAGEWVGRTDADLFPPAVAGPIVENDRQVARSGEPLRVQEMAAGADGALRTYLSIKFPVTDAAGRRFVGGAALDLTEQRRLERQQAESERVLQSQKLECLGVLAGGIAHDFNNLLTTILGYTSFAKLELGGTDPGTVRGYLDKVEKGALRAADLCRQMLAYAGKAQFALGAADLNALVEEMGQLVAASVSKKVVLRYGLAPDLPAVTCDATQIRQVVMNLITNASDAIGDRSGVVTLTTGLIDADATYLREIGSDQLPPQRYAYLEVSDTGCGMPDEVKARVFEPFFTTKFTGRGLGLSAVLGIVRGHGGAIMVDSQPGRGTTFKVLLPTAEAAPTPADDPDRTTREPFGRGRAVLVVDDEEDVRVLARKLLTRAGFAVEVAADGREGVAAFRRRPAEFAVILCDLTMPHMDGSEAFREMRAADRAVRTILTSGFAAEEATAGFEGKGLAGFLRKPFTAEELLQAVFEVTGP